MTSVGTGVGGNVGGNAIPMQRELEATAWTEINRAALGMRDSIEQAFTQINPRYSTGYLGGFGYKTTAENPLLDHPLESVRTSESFNKYSDNSWQAAYNDLVNQLPPDLLARFNRESNKPFEQRNPSFVALDNLFQLSAKVLTQASLQSQPIEANSLEEARTTLHLLLPFAALKGALTNSNEAISQAKDFLRDQGANYTYFDGFNNLLNNLQSPINLMQQVNSSLNSTTNGQLSPQAISAARKAADQLATIKSQLDRVSLGPDLQLLRSSINSMEMVATALSLPNTSTSPLFLALSLAATGLYTSDSPAGILGFNYKAVVDNALSGLTSSLMPGNSKAGNEMLSLIVTTSLPLFIGMASLALNPGFGVLPKGDSQTQETQNFAFQTALRLVVSSGIIETFYKEAIAASGGNEKAQDLGSATLALLTHLFVINCASTTSKSNDDAEVQLEELAKEINNGLIKAAEIERSAQSESTVNASIAIQIALQAIESKDYKGFLEAVNSYMESIGSSQNALNNDITVINSTATTVANSLDKGNSDQQLTNIINVM